MTSLNKIRNTKDDPSDEIQCPTYEVDNQKVKDLTTIIANLFNRNKQEVAIDEIEGLEPNYSPHRTDRFLFNSKNKQSVVKNKSRNNLRNSVEVYSPKKLAKKHSMRSLAQSQNQKPLNRFNSTYNNTWINKHSTSLKKNTLFKREQIITRGFSPKMSRINSARKVKKRRHNFSSKSKDMIKNPFKTNSQVDEENQYSFVAERKAKRMLDNDNKK